MPRFRRSSRRTLLGVFAAGSAVAIAPVRAQAPSATPATSPAAAWTFVDDRGITIALPARPERVLAQINTAASLWDFGVRPVGAWGPARNPDGTPSANAGRVDLDAVSSVTDGWDEPDLERFLALAPDLIVSTVWTPNDEAIWGIYPPELMPQVEAIAPTLALTRMDYTLVELVGRFEELAAALGADVDAAGVVAARQEFTQAVDRLAAAIAAKPGLRVLFGGAGETGFWTASEVAEPDLGLYADLGLTIVAPIPEETYSTISWEQVGRIEADLILFDARVDTGYPTLEETLARQPLFARHPAVVAGQVAPYHVEYVMSYQGTAEMVSSLAEAIERAEVLAM